MPNRSKKRLWSVLIVTWFIIAAAVYISITNGTFDISVKDVVKTLLRIDPVPDHDLVIFEFRLPRIVIGAMVGFMLGIAGAVIQGITRNGLADTGMLGINAGAGTATVVFIFLFAGQVSELGWWSVLAMPLCGLAGGLLAVSLIFLFAKENGRLDPQRLILVGIAIASGFSSLTLYVSLKMNPQDFEMATVWLAGSVYSANWTFVAAMVPWLVILVPLVWSRAYILDVFQLEENSVRSIGVSVEREKRWLLVGCVGLVSACVAVAGSIGFVGLIAPHIARRLVGHAHMRIIPVCGFIGMAMVVVGDLIGKSIFAPAQLPVGIVIAIIGVPYFVYLLFKTRG
ncbi:iron complex transport system permease protein [Paenibacillus phyllosphaerae]|uniref:Iron complex transport system permease protein n=1 Tax=Paenibacillus phyllosphaerae TaxID=274593 RepID=A0A7W5B1D7_9BACL|nr:iron ABC transporter permease [Paenibacillus phyllosphaerae]MBB3112568.1 iron complex transport system permease protein [Paenibacillus phyllosphaerae]